MKVIDNFSITSLAKKILPKALIALPIATYLGIESYKSNILDSKDLSKYSQSSQREYRKIEKEYAKELNDWIKKQEEYLKKNPSKYRIDKIKKKLVEKSDEVESQMIDKFIDYLKANGKRKELRMLLLGLQGTKLFDNYKGLVKET